MRYPIEIELTDYCTLSCECCPNKTYINKSYMEDKVFYSIIDYIFNNQDNILMVDLCGVGDIFLHPKICEYLDYIGDKFKWTSIQILIPTKWSIIQQKHIEALIRLHNKGIDYDISIGMYSLRPHVHDAISGTKNFSKMMNFILECKKNKLLFWLELLLNNFSIHELPYFYAFWKKLQTNYKVHTYHNFWGSMEESNLYNDASLYKDLECEFAWEEVYMTDHFCQYTMLFLAKDGYIYSCSHWWKQKQFRTEHILDLIVKFPKYNDLVHYITKEKLSKKDCINCTYFKD